MQQAESNMACNIFLPIEQPMTRFLINKQHATFQKPTAMDFDADKTAWRSSRQWGDLLFIFTLDLHSPLKFIIFALGKVHKCFPFFHVLQQRPVR